MLEDAATNRGKRKWHKGIVEVVPKGRKKKVRKYNAFKLKKETKKFVTVEAQQDSNSVWCIMGQSHLNFWWWLWHSGATASTKLVICRERSTLAGKWGFGWGIGGWLWLSARVGGVRKRQGWKGEVGDQLGTRVCTLCPQPSNPSVSERVINLNRCRDGDLSPTVFCPQLQERRGDILFWQQCLINELAGYAAFRKSTISLH